MNKYTKIVIMILIFFCLHICKIPNIQSLICGTNSDSIIKNYLDMYNKRIAEKKLDDSLLIKNDTLMQTIKVLFNKTIWEQERFPFIKNGRFLDKKLAKGIHDNLPIDIGGIKTKTWVKEKLLYLYSKSGPDASLYFSVIEQELTRFGVCGINYKGEWLPPFTKNSASNASYICEKGYIRFIGKRKERKYFLDAIAVQLAFSFIKSIKTLFPIGDSIPYGIGELQAGRFLDIPVGSRGRALGVGFVGLANDASALHWNPAGLGLVKYIDISFAHQIIHGDHISKRISNGIFVFPCKDKTIGIGGIYSEAKNITNSKIRPHLFNLQEGIMIIGVGKEFPQGLCLGGSLKWVMQKIARHHKNSLTIDLATIYPIIVKEKDLRIGAVTQNCIGSIAAYEETERVFPTRFRLGISAPHIFTCYDIATISIVCGLENNLRFPIKISGSFGTEIIARREAINYIKIFGVSNLGKVFQKLILRGNIGQNTSFGFGVETKLPLLDFIAKFDFAYVLPSIVGDKIIEVSVSTAF